MAGVKISALPAVPAAQLTDIYPVVQSGATAQESVSQLLTLFAANIVIAESQVTNLVADLASKLNLSGGTMTGVLNMGSHLITNVTDPLSAQDAATRAYVDSISGNFLPLAGGTMSGVINMGSHKITNLTDPTNPQDAATKFYIDNNLTNYLALAGGTMAGVINMNGNIITNLPTPTNSGDSANKGYVDSVATGLNIQEACYAATTANLTATYANGAAGIGATLTNSGALAAFSVDGVSPPLNSRILVKDQSSTLQNGIYTLTTVGSGAIAWVLTRATDYDQPSQIQPGDLVVINNGTVNAVTSWIETASVSAVGTDPILFSQFTFAPTSFLLKANNLSDVANKATSFNNISPTTTKGDLIAFDGTNNVRFAVGSTNGQILGVSSGAADGLVWSTPTYPMASGTSGKFLVSDGTNNVYSTSTIPTSAGAIANKVLLSDGTNYVLSTTTFPNASATSGKIIISDGTNWVASTATYPTSTTINQLLYSSAANVISGLATVNSAGLLTNGSGVPGWVAATGTGAPVLATSPSLITPALGTPTSGNLTNCTGVLHNIKFVTFTRDISIASGSQAITGVGFAPSAIIFFAAVSGSASTYTSWGMVSAGTSNGSISFTASTTTTFNTDSIHLQSGTNSAVASVNSFDVDGFTLGWTKVNSPTGTAQILAMCIN